MTNNKIQILDATPSIPYPTGLNTTAFKSGNNRIYVACLYSNNSVGTVKFVAGKYDNICTGNCCNDPSVSLVKCVGPTNGIMKELEYTYSEYFGSLNFACIRLYTCQLGDDCQNNSCMEWKTDHDVLVTGIPVKQENLTLPVAPVGIVVMPDDKSLVIEWNMVDDPTGGEVFAYKFEMVGGNTNISGYLNTAEKRIEILGLTNGTSYTIKVWSLSHNILMSATYAEIIGIPNIPSPKWRCSDRATNTCVRDDVNGTHESEALCKAAEECQPLVIEMWRCSDRATNTCVRDDVNGEYESEALCKAAEECQPLAVEKWRCSDRVTNTCVRDDVNGTHESEALCKAAEECQPLVIEKDENSIGKTLVIAIGVSALAIALLSMKTRKYK